MESFINKKYIEYKKNLAKNKEAQKYFKIKSGDLAPSGYETENDFYYELFAIEMFSKKEPIKLLIDGKAWIDKQDSVHSTDFIVLSPSGKPIFGQVKNNLSSSPKEISALEGIVAQYFDGSGTLFDKTTKKFRDYIEKNSKKEYEIFWINKDATKVTRIVGEVRILNHNELCAKYFKDVIYEKPQLGECSFNIVNQISYKDSLNTKKVEEPNVIISLILISELVDFAKNNLLEKDINKLSYNNIRAIVNAKKGVKTGIFETLENLEDDSRMLKLNNGITIIADGITKTNKKVIATNPTIINGQQTLQSILQFTKTIKPDIPVIVKFIKTINPNEKLLVSKTSNTQIPVAYIELLSMSYRFDVIFEAFAIVGNRYAYKKGRLTTLKGFPNLKEMPKITPEVFITGILSTVLASPHYCFSEDNRIFKPLYQKSLSQDAAVEIIIKKLDDELRSIKSIDDKLMRIVLSVKFANSISKKMYADGYIAFVNHFAQKMYMLIKDKKFVDLKWSLVLNLKETAINSVIKDIEAKRKNEGYYNETDISSKQKIDARIKRDCNFKIS